MRTPVSYTVGLSVHYFARLDAREAEILAEVARYMVQNPSKRGLYGLQLVETSKTLRTSPEASVSVSRRSEGGLVTGAEVISGRAAVLLGMYLLDPRPLDSFIESMRRISAGTAYEWEHPGLGADNVHRKS